MDCEELEEQMSQLSSELRQAHDDLKKLSSVEEELATAKQISIKLHDECERLNVQCQLYRQQVDWRRSDTSPQASLFTQPANSSNPVPMAVGVRCIVHKCRIDCLTLKYI